MSLLSTAGELSVRCIVAATDHNCVWFCCFQHVLTLLLVLCLPCRMPWLALKVITEPERLLVGACLRLISSHVVCLPATAVRLMHRASRG